MGEQRADAAGFAEQPIPRRAATVDDLVGGAEDAVREAIVSQVQPQPLDRVEFRRVGRQEDEAEVFRDHQIAGVCQPALSISTTAWAPGVTACDSSVRNRFIAAASSLVSTARRRCRVPGRPRR